MNQRTIKIGTRRSPLALVQTNLVIDQIKIYHPNINYEILPIITSGDLIKDRNLYDIGGKALFLKEIEILLLEGTIDLAVHSLKDVPGRVTEGLIIAALLEREDARDVFVSKNYKSIEELPYESVIGTSSVRRKIFIQRNRPDINIVTFRGNVNSRMRKLMRNDVDATILASSGLKRLGLFNKKYCNVIDIEQMLPSVGQGVIAIEIRENDHMIQKICDQINHLPTCVLVQAGRSFLEYLDLNCRTPIAAYSTYLEQKIKHDFMLANVDGNSIAFYTEIGNPTDSRNIGIRAAKIMSSKITGICH